MSRVVENQEASANLPERRARDFRRFSMTSVGSPVSIALELATARKMLARDTDILPEFFLRTMGRLRNEMTSEIITLSRHTAPLKSCPNVRWGVRMIQRIMIQGLLGQVAKSERLEAEIKRNLGGLRYEL